MKWLLFILLPLSVFSQDEDTTIYDFPDVEAQYVGGQAELMRFVTKNITYPECLIFEDFDGKFYFSFVVEKDGSLTDIKLERRSGSSCEEDMLEFIKKMPNWIPGEVRGVAVRTRCRLPVLICPLH